MYVGLVYFIPLRWPPRWWWFDAEVWKWGFMVALLGARLTIGRTTRPALSLAFDIAGTRFDN